MSRPYDIYGIAFPVPTTFMAIAFPYRLTVRLPRHGLKNIVLHKSIIVYFSRIRYI